MSRSAVGVLIVLMALVVVTVREAVLVALVAPVVARERARLSRAFTL